MTLPRAYLDRPVAHRALHDATRGRPENSLAAVRAAVAAGYPVEIDLQPSRDGVPMVFHDYDLGRLTAEAGPVRQRDAEELSAIALKHGDEGIPTLAQVLETVGGRVPLLIEVKDQDGDMGPDIGPLEAAAVRILDGYTGPVALMSFNPHSVAALARLAPHLPRGLTTCNFLDEDWPTLTAATRNRLRDIPDFDAVQADFISHYHRDLTNPSVTALRARGVPVLCWTIRTSQDEAAARRLADNITFEGYAA